MPPLSVVIIARDEADRLPDALRSVAFAEERLVLDSGSVDGTPEVARALGARVVETDWPGHVAQKNRGLELATHDWVLSLDADERLGPALAAALREALATEPVVDGFSVARRNHYLGRPLGWGGWYPDRRVRLVRRACARWGGTDPHDRLQVTGRVAQLPGDLDHYPYRDAQEHLATIARYARRAAEVDPTPGRAWDPLARPAWRFLRGYLLQLGFLDGRAGLQVAWLGARYTHLKWRLRAEAARDGSEHGCDER